MDLFSMELVFYSFYKIQVDIGYNIDLSRNEGQTLHVVVLVSLSSIGVIKMVLSVENFDSGGLLGLNKCNILHCHT